MQIEHAQIAADERRRYERYACPHGAQARHGDGWRDCAVTDISAGGASVASDERPPVGDAVTLSARALPKDLIGTVSAIGLEIGRQSILADDPAANTNARVVTVTITLNKTSSTATTTFTNLKMITHINTDPAP